MKKIINNARYDTDKAAILATYRKVGEYAETLYRSKVGKYFLHGTGQGKYAAYDDNGRIHPGERIIPMSREIAQQWAMENLTKEEYEGIFESVDESRESTTITLPIALKTKLWSEAERRKIPLSLLIEELLTKNIEP